jgi:hypothetical protein
MKSDNDLPTIATIITLKRNSAASAVSELHLYGIPVKTGIIDVAHIAKLAEDGSARSYFGGGDCRLAGDCALNKIEHLVLALVKLNWRGVERVNALDGGNSALKAFILLNRSRSSIISARVAGLKNTALKLT